MRTVTRPWPLSRNTIESVRTTGFTNPVLIDAENMVLAGHGRVATERLPWHAGCALLAHRACESHQEVLAAWRQAQAALAPNNRHNQGSGK